MSQSKHRSFRRILSISTVKMTISLEAVSVTQVLWCIVDKENSRSIFSTHVALTVYVGGRKFNGVSARMPKKPYRLEKRNPNACEGILDLLVRGRAEALSHAALEYMGRNGDSKRFTGRVEWCSSGTGFVQCDELGSKFVFHTCNFENADSAYPELVKNINVGRHDIVSFSLSKDAHLSKACGAINLRLEQKVS